MSVREVRPEDLHAYADGRLSEEDRRAVERHLESDPADATRVADYQRMNAGLVALFAPVTNEPVPERLLAVVDRRGHAGWPWMRMAAAAACLAVGLGVGTGIGWWAWGGGADRGKDALVAELARPAQVAYAVYAADVRHPVEVGRDQRDHLVTWLSNRLGRPVPAPDLGSQGLTLVGGRLLPATEGPAAQLMYETARGDRITLYMRTGERDTGETAFRYLAGGDGLNAVYWVDRSFGWALSAPLPRSRLEEIAHAVYQQTR